MRVAIIYSHPYPEGRAVLQLISLLTRLEIEVDVVALFIRQGQTKKASTLVKYFGMVKRPCRAKELYYKSFPLCDNWKRKLQNIYACRKWDLIIVRESLLANSCIWIGKKYSIPVLLDMRENRPDMIISNSFGFKKIMAKPYVKLVRIHEKKYLPKFDHIFTVSDELKNWTIETYNINNTKISTLANYPAEHILKTAHRFKKTDYNSLDDLKLVFAGYVSFSRGLQYILPAMKILKRKDFKVSLHIIGSGAYIKTLKYVAESLSVKDIVFFYDMIHPDDLMKTLSQYDIGLAPYIVNRHTNVTVPGKLFEYMAVGLPILSSPRKSVIRIINECRCGIIYNSCDPFEISEKIVTLYNVEFRKKLGIAGRKAVEQKFNESSNIRILKNILFDYV